MNTQRIGLDIGFGNAKLACLDNTNRIRTTVFPAILGHANSRATANVGLGGKRKRITIKLTIMLSSLFF